MWQHYSQWPTGGSNPGVLGGGQIKWHMLTVELFSLEKDGGLTRATAGMAVKDIVRREISQSQESRYCMILLI